MIKLLKLLELVRALVQQLSSTWQSRAISILQRDSEVLEHVQFAMMEVSSSVIFETDIDNSNGVLEMAFKLSLVYKDPGNCFKMGGEKWWKHITRVLEDCLEQFPSLRTLLLYYLVSTPPLSFLSFTCPSLRKRYCLYHAPMKLMKTYAQICRNRYVEAAENLLSLLSHKSTPLLTRHVRARFQYINQQLHLKAWTMPDTWQQKVSPYIIV
jgi:hypothetical protein